jgi:hypothetical protein
MQICRNWVLVLKYKSLLLLYHQHNQNLKDQQMYKITKEQMDQIAQMLADCPAKFAIPVVDLLRHIAATQMIEEEKKV